MGFEKGKKENGGDWMASPSSSSSYLNSTCALLAVLDFDEKHNEVRLFIFFVRLYFVRNFNWVLFFFVE